MIFVASINTVIYGASYLAGESVDTDGWNRKQLLQFLGNGLIFPFTPVVFPEVTAASFTHRQDVPAQIWEFDHPLLFIPAVTVIDSSGDTVLGDVELPSASSVRVTFSVPFSGSVYLS